MKLMLIGANYQTAPLEFREKLAITRREKAELTQRLMKEGQVSEMIILNTCNRIEFYFLLDAEAADDMIWEWMSNRTGEGVLHLQEFMYIYTGMDVVYHLMRVVCGLDSMILGEEQILGQVRDAYQQGIDAGSVSTYLHQLISEALRVGKRVRTETGISRQRASIASAGVEFVQKVFDDMRTTRALILGAGEIATLALQALCKAGVRDIVVINRDAERGQELAREFGGVCHSWTEKQSTLLKVDLVISSTSAPHYVITRDDLRGLHRPENRPLVLMDIAVPRDVEPEVRLLSGVKVFNIDDLEQSAYKYLEENGHSIGQALEMIHTEAQVFALWLRARKVYPVIREFREKAELIRQNELEKVRPRLEQWGNEGTTLVQELTRRIVAKLLHEPTVQLKKMAGEDIESSLAIACQLYNLTTLDQKEESVCQTISPSCSGCMVKTV